VASFEENGLAEVLRGGVIGAGVFGGHHARKYAALDGVVLSAVLDIDPERAAALAMPLGGRAFSDLAEFLEAVDVVTVAAPASVHGQFALAALKAGKPVYVEKPLAVSLEDADRIIAEAAKRGLVVACGHQERVVFQTIGLFDIPEQPLRLEAIRQNAPSERSLDVSVVLDVMIHDLDLALALTTGEPVAVEAEGHKDFSGDWDQVHAEATFDNGFTAIVHASRMAAGRQRTMKLTYPSGEVEVDFVGRTFRNTTPYPLNADFADTPAVKDTLATSVEGFLQAVRGLAPRPVVTAEEAARALDLALAVEQALEDRG
jgi:predicted dehydrogenase